MYIHYEKKERALLRSAEKGYNNKLLQENATNPRKTWEVLNGILPQAHNDKAQTYDTGKKSLKDLCNLWWPTFLPLR